MDGQTGSMGRDREIAREQAVVDRLYERLDALREQTRERLAEIRRRGSTGTPQARSERDAFATMYEDRLAQLTAVEPGLCFGRLDRVEGERLHIGRIGLTDDRHDTLLVDWRAPAAEPFYRATATEPLGVTRRRQLRTRARQVVDVEDEVFDIDNLTDAVRETLGGGGALLAALNASRTGRMSDIVATIQAEQDRVIRADLAGVLAVQGGPGTGKTAVALHRAAYLLYTHRDRLARSGVLVVGPGPAFMRYIEQVLPSLGETGVLLSTVDDLLAEVDVTGTEASEVAVLKADPRMADLVAAAVADRQRVPAEDVTLEFEDHELRLSPRAIATARARARRSRRRHNRARYAFAKQLLRFLVARLAELDAELAADRWVLRSLMASEPFRALVDTCWPRLTPAELLRDLFAPDRLAAVADGLLSPAEQTLLVRAPDAPWTAADVPLLDEARSLLGDPDEVLRAAAERRRQRADRAYARQVVAATGMRGQVDADQLARRYARAGDSPRTVVDVALRDPDWQFGHVVVDEAQELSPMAWRMLVRRCPLRSMTVVGDVTQAAAPWATRDWPDTLQRVAPERWRVAELTVNYRTPTEIMTLAADVLAAVDPAARPPESVRESGSSPRAHRADETQLPNAAAAVAGELQAALGGGKVAVVVPPRWYDAVVDAVVAAHPGKAATGAAGLDADIAILSTTEVKGLEFDGVVVVEPNEWVREGASGLRQLYVALTRATQRLEVIHAGALPAVLGRLASA
jgi:DNA helicase IV